MAKLYITPENQIQRLNGVFLKVQELQNLPFTQLTTPLDPKSWSVLEVIEHLNKSYLLYYNKLEAALQNLPDTENDPSEFKARVWQKIVIEAQRPKNGVVKWKLKTLKRFEPLLDLSQLDQGDANKVFEDFNKLHQHLKTCILESRNKELKKTKITSAIGPIVLFYLPECYEFLICHIERHMVQIEGILSGIHQ
ncbi:DinB family protein [Muricauda sp. 2012CJ35-5]|uniref:DinB family protein n=1 Tax=Flagellimonas spongiicola TaxID=2942208 RepID=A0ABT0PS00_9FLAO|nr:DinB family protein [Allomuricauda spongiicola]MCL6274158.1 DinB family protein [Allomuricauda spongiicola]